MQKIDIKINTFKNYQNFNKTIFFTMNIFLVGFYIILRKLTEILRTVRNQHKEIFRIIRRF